MARPLPEAATRSPLAFLPRQLRPNRQRPADVALPEMPQLGATARLLSAALQYAVEENFAALMAHKPPAPLDVRAFAPLGAIEVAGPRPWWDRARIRLLALFPRLLRRRTDPQPPASGAAELLDPATARGGAILLPALVEQALGDAAFRLRLGERCRVFLEDRVLFHPGPAPAPLFSPGGAALLIATQEAHGRALGPAYEELRQAAQRLRGPGFVLGFWDEWLLRRIRDAPGWVCPDDLPPLPWAAPAADSDIAPPFRHSLMELVP